MKKEELREIVGIQLKGIQRLLNDQKIAIELSPAAQDWLVNIGYDPAYGARPLKRAIRRELQNPIATKILENTFTAGDKIIVDCVDDKLIFNKETLPIVIEPASSNSQEPAKAKKTNKPAKSDRTKTKQEEKPEAVSSET